MTAEMKEWMLGLQGHEDLVPLEEVVRLIRAGQLRSTDMVKRVGEPWSAAGEVPELAGHFAPQPTPRTSRKTARFRHSEPGRNEKRVPPARPKGLEPLVAKYFSPNDLLRAMTFALAPGKLATAALVLVPATAAFTLARGEKYGVAAGVLLAIAVTMVVLVLDFFTRRQVEGIDAGWREAGRHLVRNVGSLLGIPLTGALPPALILGLLVALEWVRTSSAVFAAGLRIAYIVPFALGLGAAIAGIGALSLLMVGGSALAVEGCGFREALRITIHYVRSQTGRMLVHVFLVSGIVLLGFRFSSWILEMAFQLPMTVGRGDWLGRGIERTVYQGVRDGLALVVPASLLSTLSVLSYLVLRQEDVVYTTESGEERDETAVSGDDERTGS